MGMRIIILILSITLLPSLCFAGEIYGTIREDGRSVEQRAQVEVRCGSRTYPPVQTDRYGSYRLYAEEKGACVLTVRYQNQSPSLEIFSYDRSVRYDLTLIKKSGQYSLMRE